MPAERTCIRCGTQLPDNAPGGRCPKCLIELALEESRASQRESRAEGASTPGAQAQHGVLPEKTVVLHQLDLVIERTGMMIGRYKLLQQIGEGGFGTVFMAEQQEPVQRKVALKIIKAGMDTREVVARFEAERQALALMDHPNIAQVLDGGATASGRPYFVMELVRGIPITNYCDHANLSTRERLELFIKVCRAVQHAHQKGVIHRDLKPTNVLVTLHDGEPVPKVIDFGVAKALGQKLTDKTLFTRFEQMIGTPAYMSPEQAALSGLDIDTRSDIYSLGALLYELLTGVTPFDAETLRQAALDEVRRMIQETEPPKPSTRLLTLGERLADVAKHRHVEPGGLRRLIRGDLDWITMKALEKDRRRRYETVNGFALDIERHLKDEAVVARPPSALYRMQKAARRHRVAFAAVGAVLAALLFGVVGSTWQAMRANAYAKQVRKSSDLLELKAMQIQKSADELELNLYAADIYLAQNAIKEGNYGLAKQALLAHAPRKGIPDVRGIEWAYFWKLCQGDKLASWKAHSNVVNSIAVSPDGKIIASTSLEHEAKLWDAASHRHLATLPEADTVAFSPEAHLLFTASSGGLVRILKVGTWERTLEFNTGDRPWESEIAQIAVSPTDPIVAVCTDGNFFGGRGSVRLYNYLTGLQIRRLANSGNRMAFSRDGKTLVTGSADGQIRVWDEASGMESKRLSGIGGSGVCSLALSPDGRLLATTEFWDFSVRLWDLTEGRELAPLRGHNAMVWSVAFSPDGRILASSSSDQTIRLWDVETRKQTAVFVGHQSEIWTLGFSATGEFLCSGSKDETVAIWPARPLQQKNAIPSVLWGSAPPIFASDGRTVVAPSTQGGLVVADTSTAEVTATLFSEKAGLWFSADSKTLMTLGTNDALNFWDLPTHALRRSSELTSRLGPISQAVASKDGKFFASAVGSTLGIQVWETSSGLQMTILKGYIPRITRLEFSPDGRRLAASGSFLIELWDLKTPNPFVTFRGHKSELSWVAFSPDGDTLASSSVDNTVKLWTVSGRRELTTLRGHREGVLNVSFSPDGKTLATASADRSFKLWNVLTHREVAWFRHSALVYGVVFSPDSRNFAYVCENNQLNFLRCPSLVDVDASLVGERASEAALASAVPVSPP